MELVKWINEELERRGWTQRELARRADISPGQLSMVINQSRGGGPEFCKNIARAFGEPPEKVFRLAGLLPPFKNELEEGAAEFLYHWDRLTEAQQHEIAHMVKSLDEYNQEREREERDAQSHSGAGIEAAPA
jgi:transcriptional regulator with XRE-family HTH domain